MPVKAFLICAVIGLAIIVPAEIKPIKKASSSAVYEIDYIELTNKNVIVHFQMKANRQYTLQASPVMPTEASNWVNIITLPKYPFDLHYPYSETYANKPPRFFRLRVQ